MRKEYLFFLIFPISQILMIAGDYAVMQNTDIFGSAGFIMSILADIVLLYILIRGAKKEKVEKELEELKYLKELETERNAFLENGHQEVYRMRDEFQKRIDEIAKSVEAGRKQEVLKDMEELQADLDKTKANIYCQNMIVNAVISEKAKECTKKGIILDVNLIIPRHLEVEPLHMCSIFSNLLDNAIEAVEALGEKNNKISITAELKGNYLFIKAKNPAAKEYVSRKRRKERGYGTKILADIAERYEGKYDAVFKNGSYAATIAVKAV